MNGGPAIGPGTGAGLARSGPEAGAELDGTGPDTGPEPAGPGPAGIDSAGTGRGTDAGAARARAVAARLGAGWPLRRTFGVGVVIVTVFAIAAIVVGWSGPPCPAPGTGS
jgi:hypothetical protein